MGSARSFLRIRQARAGAATLAAASVALLRQYRRSLRAIFVFERIGESPATMFEKPKWCAEDRCKKRVCAIRWVKSEFLERALSRGAFLFRRIGHVAYPLSFYQVSPCAVLDRKVWLGPAGDPLRARGSSIAPSHRLQRRYPHKLGDRPKQDGARILRQLPYFECRPISRLNMHRTATMQWTANPR